MNITYPIFASFGAAKSGLVASVGYRVIATDGTTLIPRTNTGIVERVDAAGNAASGVYAATPILNTDWGAVSVVWDIAGLAGVVAEETVNVGAYLNLTQPVPTTNTAHTVGDALNAARAQGFGSWTISGSSVKLFASDNVTVVKEFLLDDALNPMTRTAA